MNLQGILAGIAGGITAVTCCIAPVVLVLLGFSTALGMSIMHRFHFISIVSSIILVILLTLFLIKRKSGACNSNSIRNEWHTLAIVGVAMIASWLVLNYLIISPLASIVYAAIPLQQKPLGNLEEIAKMHKMNLPEIKVIPENEGNKKLLLQIAGIVCGSCGPAIDYDIRSITGVLSVQENKDTFTVFYDSNTTNKEIILGTVHEPYTVKILSEECELKEKYIPR